MNSVFKKLIYFVSRLISVLKSEGATLSVIDNPDRMSSRYPKLGNTFKSCIEETLVQKFLLNKMKSLGVSTATAEPQLPGTAWKRGSAPSCHWPRTALQTHLFPPPELCRSQGSLSVSRGPSPPGHHSAHAAATVLKAAGNQKGAWSSGPKHV